MCYYAIMSEIKQTPFIVTENDEIVTELSHLPPTGIEAVAANVRAGISHVTGAIALQARMATFDTLHGTNYRRIRNNLVAQKRREDFERSIGLVAIDHKQ
jgi:hypothetical protein